MILKKIILFVCCILLMATLANGADPFHFFEKHIEKNDAILLADPMGNILYSKNSHQKMIPASTIKIFTTLAAFHFLGKDYRFKTEFYLDSDRNLFIKGYGDPCLVSEVVNEIAQKLAPLVKPMINNLFVDDSHFSQPLTIPGISSTRRPHDAPNGALSVNFNTVYFTTGRTPGTFTSAESQTPLLPFAIKKIKQSGQNKNRIVLSHNENDIAIYAGMMFGHFLKKNGLHIQGKVQVGQVNKNSNLIWVYHSQFTLEEITRQLLEYSNNFIANQILIVMGIEKYGPPGNLRKGVDAIRSYAGDHLNFDQLTIAEGSGISRKNQVCADTMLKILEAFRPSYFLLKKEKQAFYKTGTLSGISNLAGYIETDLGLYPFVIFLNSGKKQAFPIMEKLMKYAK